MQLLRLLPGSSLEPMLLRILLLPLFFSLLELPAAAAPSIQRFFAQFSDHQFVMLEEITRLDEGSKIGPFGKELLEESTFRSYSRWQVERAQNVGYRLEVFDLLDTYGAFSLFTLWPRFQKQNDWKALQIQTGNKYRPGEGVFWRGNYLLRVTANPGRTLTAGDFSEIVTVFCESTPLENIYPVSISHLPPEGLVSSSVEFYLGSSSLALNERFPEPLLKEIGFVDRIEIAFGRYGSDDSCLFLIGYPTPALADQYFIRLQEGLHAFFSSEGIYMKRAGVLIALLVGPEASAQRILLQVEYSPAVKWLYVKESDTYTREVISFLGLLTKTILGTGVFILLIVGAGLVAGLTRYAVLRRFPRLKRHKDMVRLNLDLEDH